MNLALKEKRTIPTKLKEKQQQLPLQRTMSKKGKGMGLPISDR